MKSKNHDRNRHGDRKGNQGEKWNDEYHDTEDQYAAQNGNPDEAETFADGGGLEGLEDEYYAEMDLSQEEDPEKVIFAEGDSDQEMELEAEVTQEPDLNQEIYAEKDSERRTYVKQDQELEDEEWEEEDDGWEEETPPLKTGLMVAVFIGLTMFAAIICFVLWQFTHPASSEGEDMQARVTASPEPVARNTPEPSSEPVAQNTPEPSSEPVAQNTPEPSSEPVAQNTPEPSSEPVAQITPEPDSKPTAEPGQQAVTAPNATEDPDGQMPVSGNTAMVFTTVQESVMPKDVLNLRSLPTTTDADNIVAQVKNGEVLLRTGINEDTGWSKIEYNGETLYAVSQYLTADLQYKTPEPPTDPNRVSTAGGRVIVFTACDDWISPKEYVNLRTEPSTSEGDATVSCQLNAGEQAHRTGISFESGWSRVEYNGEVLYVVTSFVNVVTEE